MIAGDDRERNRKVGTMQGGVPFSEGQGRDETERTLFLIINALYAENRQHTPLLRRQGYAAVKVWLTLTGLGGLRDFTTLSIAEIASRTGYGKTSVAHGIGLLQAHGYIEAAEVNNQEGRTGRLSRSYRLKIPRVALAAYQRRKIEEEKLVACLEGGLFHGAQA